jgi:hypothetical protein
VNQNPSPDPDKIGDLFWGVIKPQFLRLALQLDLFSPLDSGPATPEMVAKEIKCHHKPIRALLDYFCSLQILNKSGDEYSLTPTAEAFLLPRRKAYAGDMILHYTSHELWDNVLGALRSGNPRWLGENFVQDAWLESYSTWRIPKSLEMWQAAGARPGMHDIFRILDLACGCGIKSMALAQTEPAVRVTCLDAPEVLVVARDLAERMQISSQIKFLPADLLNANLGAPAGGAANRGYLAQGAKLNVPVIITSKLFLPLIRR